MKKILYATRFYRDGDCVGGGFGIEGAADNFTLSGIARIIQKETKEHPNQSYHNFKHLELSLQITGNPDFNPSYSVTLKTPLTQEEFKELTRLSSEKQGGEK